MFFHGDNNRWSGPRQPQCRFEGGCRCLHGRHAKEVAAEGIRVNTIRPGMTLTDMTAATRDDPAELASVSATIAMKRFSKTEEMAQPILFLLSDAASFISGVRLDASGGGFVSCAETPLVP